MSKASINRRAQSGIETARVMSPDQLLHRAHPLPGSPESTVPAPRLCAPQSQQSPAPVRLLAAYPTDGSALASDFPL